MRTLLTTFFGLFFATYSQYVVQVQALYASVLLSLVSIVSSAAPSRAGRLGGAAPGLRKGLPAMTLLLHQSSLSVYRLIFLATRVLDMKSSRKGGDDYHSAFGQLALGRLEIRGLRTYL